MNYSPSTVSFMLVSALAGFPIFAQANLPVAGVVEFEVAAQNISCEGWNVSNCNQELSKGFRAMLETAIIKSGRMNVMERSRMDAIMQERMLGSAGVVEGQDSLGGISGIDYVVYGAITKFGMSTSAVSISSTKGVGSLMGRRGKQAAAGGMKSSSVEVEMEVDLKTTDMETGQIVTADYVSAIVKTGQAMSVGGIETGGAAADPYADVQRVVAVKITEAVVTTKFPVKVIVVQKDGTIVINYGNVFFKEGDQLVAFEVGESFVDPDTGLALGAEETETGRIEITRSDAKVSRARIIGEPFNIAAGNVLKRAKDKITVGKKSKKSSW